MTPALVLTGVGLILVITPQRIVDRVLPNGLTGRAGKAFGVVFFLFAGSMTACATWTHYSQQSAYRQLERADELSFVEGCLQGFHPMAEAGHENEVLQVGGVRFWYSDFDESFPGFNNTASHGGPMRADTAVRVWYAGNSIVRLEVKDHACPPAPDLPQPG